MNGTPTDIAPPSGAAPLLSSSEAAPPALHSGPFFQRPDWLSSLAAAALTLAVYLFSLSPEVGLEFSGILSTGARYGGVAHPPGFPLWTLYAWLFTVLLPFSNVAWRVALSSAVAGALTCGLIALIVSCSSPLILERLARFTEMPGKTQNRIRLVCGVIAGAGFGFDGCFWRNCVTVETWALGILLFAVTLCLLLRWTQDLRWNRYLYAAFFCYGLTLTVSLYLAIVALGLLFIVLFAKPALGRDLSFVVTVALAAALGAHFFGSLPDTLLFMFQIDALYGVYFDVLLVTGIVSAILIFRTRRLLTEWRTVCCAVPLLFLALSLYLYIVVTSMTNPPVNWGYPRTVEGFFHTIGRGQYERLHPTDSLFRWALQLWQYLKQTLSDFGLFYSAAALIGFCFICKSHARARAWMLGLLASFFCLSGWMVAMLNASPDRSVMDLVKDYFAASYVILAIWSGYGLAILTTIFGSRTPKLHPDLNSKSSSV